MYFLDDNIGFGNNNIIEIKYSDSSGIFVHNVEYDYDSDGFPTRRTETRTFVWEDDDGEEHTETETTVIEFTYIVVD